MTVLAVDDEYHALECLKKAVLKVIPDCTLACFDSSADALDYAAGHQVDVAFLDIRVDGMTGLEIAQRLKEIYGNTNIIFVTAYDEYMGNAFRLHASGYLEKPVSAEDIAAELEHLRSPVRTVAHRVRIQTFGSFEIFVNGSPVIFHRPKAKEALAYLVDRNGASVSKKELAAVLWENRNYTRSIQSHLYKLIRDMEVSLREAGAGEIVFVRRGVYALNTAEVSCDYYEYNRGDVVAVNSYRGEYMCNYSWAEFTAGLLSSRLNH